MYSKNLEVLEMEKCRIGYSSSKEIKDYLEFVAERYNMTLSGVMTMIIQQYRFQEESIAKLESLNRVIEQLAIVEGGSRDEK